jgi:TM2 domain-containing membrane protein YozV
MNGLVIALVIVAIGAIVTLVIGMSGAGPTEGLFFALLILAAILGVALVFSARRRERIRRHAVGEHGRIGEVDVPREKSPVIAYIFWLIPPLGQLGGPRYYLGKYLTGILYTFTGSLLTIGWIVDAFLIPRMTRNANRKVWENWFARQSDRWMDSSGTVRDFSVTQQSDMAGQVVTPKQVMNFRIEETNEEGDVSQVIEVELIGNRISGNLRNGDAVTIHGKMSKENILRALSVENKTTNSRVTVSF